MTFAVFLQHHAKSWTDFHWWTVDRVTAFGQMVGAIGTLLAFAVAFWLLLKQLKQFKASDADRLAEWQARANDVELRRRQVAERVVAWASGESVYDREYEITYQNVTMKNTADVAVFFCQVYLVDTGDYPDESLPLSTNADYFVDVLAPGEPLSVELKHKGANMFMPGVEIHFTDPAGIEWKRDPFGRLGSIEEKPQTSKTIDLAEHSEQKVSQ